MRIQKVWALPLLALLMPPSYEKSSLIVRPPDLQGNVRIYTGGWTADTNGSGSCEDDAPTVYVAEELPHGKFRIEAEGRRLNGTGVYDSTLIVKYDVGNGEVTQWNQESHHDGPQGNGELLQTDQFYDIDARPHFYLPTPEVPIEWYFTFKLHHNGVLIEEFECEVEVEVG
jgi:hypothetical protein